MTKLKLVNSPEQKVVEDVTPRLRHLIYRDDNNAYSWGVIVTFGDMEIDDPRAWIFENREGHFITRIDAKKDLMRFLSEDLEEKINNYVAVKLEEGAYIKECNNDNEEDDATNRSNQDDTNELDPSI